MLRVSDCAGSEDGSPMTPPPVLPSASHNSVGTPEGLISQLDGWPACAPVNASPAALRPPPHDSGSGWLAGPSRCDSFIRYSLPVLPAHYALGESRRDAVRIEKGMSPLTAQDQQATLSRIPPAYPVAAGASDDCFARSRCQRSGSHAASCSAVGFSPRANNPGSASRR